MKIHRLSVEEALGSLQSSSQGLSAHEALRRIEEFGPNRVERVRGKPLFARFLQEFTHFFALILWVATALAFVAEWSDPGHGMAALGAAVLGVIVVNGVFSFWQEYRAERAISALQRLLPHRVKALRDTKITETTAEELVPGDVILLEGGDDIPADSRLIQAFGVRVNTATVTGESLPKARDARPSSEEDLLRSKNILLAGTSVVSGEARAVVFATGMRTEFGKIAHLTQTAGVRPSPLQREIAYVSRVVAILATVLGVVFFFIGQAVGLSFWANFIFAIGIIVANVPEGLLPTVTLSLAMASQRMAKRHALIRHLPAVEALGSATVICTDKTGTLTQNRMEAKRLFLAGTFYDPGDVGANGRMPRYEFHRPFFEGAWRCHNLKAVEKEGASTWLGDPMEVALVEMAKRAIPDIAEYPRLDEVPFDSDRKRLSVLVKTPHGFVLYTKGALEALLPLCRAGQIGSEARPLTPELAEQYLRAQDEMARMGFRVLAFAHRDVSEPYDPFRLEEGLVLSGLVGLEDPSRPEVPEAIRTCREAGIKVIMVTGDHPHTAEAIARQIGLVHTSRPLVIIGEQLGRMSDTQLQLAISAPEIIFARVAADQKMQIVSALQAKKEIVAMTGDGVNDAPALRQADIGIAMGIAGTDVAREAADMVLMDDNFASIVAAVEEGRAAFDNIRKFLTYILTSNIPEIVPYLAFVLFRIPLPLTIIQILAVDLGTDMVPALALGAEPPHPRIMQRPPRPRGERLLSRSLILRAYVFLGVIEAAAAMAAYFFVLERGGWEYGRSLGPSDPLYLQATTACLSAIIVMQVVNVFLCRDDRTPSFAYGFFSNPLILWGIVTEVTLILLIDYTPWGNLIFGTAPLAPAVWVLLIPFAVAMLALEELRKWMVRNIPR
ncbi:MAG: cation-transporting P-type ATPase [Nitrospirae bacterium]|nr:cation-transporting P-type ATPase [Nitrospirota bacterium]